MFKLKVISKGKFVEREITLGAGCRIEWTSVFEG